MKKIISALITLTLAVSIAFASIAAEAETEEPGEIISTEYVLRVNHLYRFFQGSDDSQKSVRTECPIKDGDTVEIGGLSDLVITVESIKDDTLSFTTNYSYVIYGTEDYSTSYTVKAGEELDLIDMGICDASSEYIISLIKIDNYDIENFRDFTCDMDGDKEAEQIFFSFIDNGCEAYSLNEINLISKGKPYVGYIEQAYDLLSLKAVTDTEGTHLEAEFTTGDFYNHDEASVYTITFDGSSVLVEQ
ncbi:MAG: hypothetical protein HUJ76_05820 [Parasporobacterium sp.]|nr:hypothetical protein [Parasporobacterium sp.]